LSSLPPSLAALVAPLRHSPFLGLAQRIGSALLTPTVTTHVVSGTTGDGDQEQDPEDVGGAERAEVEVRLTRLR
jgi:hypothetical protein